MATVDITDIRPNKNSFADGLCPPAALWVPPLAPNGTTAAGHVFMREDAIRPVTEGEDPFQPSVPSDLSETKTRFGSRGKLIAGTAIIAALGVASLAYVLLASPRTKASAETAESSPIAAHSSSETPAQVGLNVPEPPSPTKVESSPETPVQAAPTAPQPSGGASGEVPSPDVPPSVTAEVSPQVAPTAVTPQIVSASKNGDLVFLQRPGVNIRSAPSGNAPVLGTAPMGTQFTATNREGDWVQVENSRLKGWISSQFLASNKPR